MSRPLLTRAAREACPHPQTAAIRADIPNSYGGRQWCRYCGVFFIGVCPSSEDDVFEAALALTEAAISGRGTEYDGIDWPATDSADREEIERQGQGRLPL